MKLILILTFSFFSVFAASENPVYGKNGMIVSTSKQASQAGIEILKKVEMQLMLPLQLALLSPLHLQAMETLAEVVS